MLVQVGVDATAAGVLVTAHPTDPTDTHTHTINAKSGLKADAAQKLRGVFPKDRPLDIEWLFANERLYIVQSRPYMGGPTRTAP